MARDHKRTQEFMRSVLLFFLF